MICRSKLLHISGRRQINKLKFGYWLIQISNKMRYSISQKKQNMSKVMVFLSFAKSTGNSVKNMVK